jgi:mono/diheme cytochrome c family protein
MNGRIESKVARVLAAAAGLGLAFCAQADSSLWALAAPKTDQALTDPLIRHGKAVFDAHCRTCHAPATSPASRGNFPGTYALEMRYQGKLPAALEQRTDLTADRVTVVVRHGGGGFMPPLRPTELNDGELKAVAAYLSRPAAAR